MNNKGNGKAESIKVKEGEKLDTPDLKLPEK